MSDKIIEALRQWGTNQPQGDDGWSWDWCIDPRAEDAIYEIHRLRNNIEYLRNRHRAAEEHMAQEIAYLESELQHYKKLNDKRLKRP